MAAALCSLSPKEAIAPDPTVARLHERPEKWACKIRSPLAPVPTWSAAQVGRAPPFVEQPPRTAIGLGSACASSCSLAATSEGDRRGEGGAARVL